MARDRDHQGDDRGPASAGPPPLDPALILRARAALNAAGLPGDAVSDEAVAGLVVVLGWIFGGLSLMQQMDILNWKYPDTAGVPVYYHPDPDGRERRTR
jgi:hypothetical protein